MRTLSASTKIGGIDIPPVSMFFAQLVKLRGLPCRASEFPALEEYGATLAKAEAAETRRFRELKRDRKAGKVFEFTGKLP